MAYTKYTINANSNNYGGARNSTSIKYLIYHYTANKTDKAVSNANYFKNNVVKASAHYFVDDTSVYQSVPDLRIAWAVGGNKYSDCSSTGGGSMYKIVTNTNSLSIEMCSTNGRITEATIENAVELGKELMSKYHIQIENVYRHFDITGKHCPGWIGWWGKTSPLWDDFRNRLANNTSSNIPKSKTENIKLTELGLSYAKVFTGINESDIKKAKARVLQHAMNLDYKANQIIEDGIFGAKSKTKLGSHYVTNGEKQYMVTALEILLYLDGFNPNGVEYPGVYGNGVIKAVKEKFGGTGTRVNAADFLKLLS